MARKNYDEKKAKEWKEMNENIITSQVIQEYVLIMSGMSKKFFHDFCV